MFLPSRQAKASYISEVGVDQANAVIIGGGAIDCAIARALSAKWDDIFLLEALPKLAMGASSHDSKEPL